MMETRIKKLLIGISAIILCIVCFPACEYDYVVPTVESVPSSVSFTNDVVPIFSANCALSGCHVSGGISPDLSTADDAYTNLYAYGLVDTTDADESILYQRLTSATKPMPPTGKLSSHDISMVEAWIKQGGLDN